MTDPTPFLRVLSARPFQFGTEVGEDCGLALDDYVSWARRLNQRPAEDLRGLYDDEPSCIRLLRERGGLLRIVARLARGVGLHRVGGPDYPLGCIAVVRFGAAYGRESHFGAIRTRTGRWAIKCNAGLTMTRDVKVAAAWEV